MQSSSEKSDTFKTKMTKSKIRMTKEMEATHRREVIKTIFFSFVITLPIFNTLFSIFIKKKRTGTPSSKELFERHKLAG